MKSTVELIQMQLRAMLGVEELGHLDKKFEEKTQIADNMRLEPLQIQEAEQSSDESDGEDSDGSHQAQA